MNNKSLIVSVFVLAGLANAGFAATEKTTELGYSTEIINEVRLIDVKTDENKDGFKVSEQKHISISTESDAVQEQLTELSDTRGFASWQSSNSDEIRLDVLEYWSRNGIIKEEKIVPLDPKFSNEIKNTLNSVLTKNGYSVKTLNLFPTTKFGMIRGDIRVVKPIGSKYAYNEIQQNLAQVKELCLKATTVNGTCHLSEMTIFIVEDPRNNYYYEKTILGPIDS